VKCRIYAMQGRLNLGRHTAVALRYEVFRRGYLAGQFKRKPKCPIAAGELRWWWRWGCDWGTASRRFFATTRPELRSRFMAWDWPHCHIYGPQPKGDEPQVVGRIALGKAIEI